MIWLINIVFVLAINAVATAMIIEYEKNLPVVSISLIAILGCYALEYFSVVSDLTI